MAASGGMNHDDIKVWLHLRDSHLKYDFKSRIVIVVASWVEIFQFPLKCYITFELYTFTE